MLLHVVLPGEGFVASGAVDVFLASMFLAVAGGMTGGGERVSAREACSVRAWVFLLEGLGGRGRGVGGGCGRGGHGGVGER